MIKKSEIMTMASECLLRPDVIEKDYVLGWLLAGISAHNALRDSWIFKGGTCLKKCHFETYRFSEDLDFTLRDPNQLEQKFLLSTFAQVTDWIYERSGIEFPIDQLVFDFHQNSRGNYSCQGKVCYKGPISSQKNPPRVKLDLTADECLVLPPTRMQVFHSYSDYVENRFEILSYAYEEVFAEKVRALGDRTRPRDLYDVVNLFRNDSARPDAKVLCDVLQQKCEFKGLSLPNFEMINAHIEPLKSSWNAMLAHQLPALPNIQEFLDELPKFFSWLYNNERVHVLPPVTEESIIIRERAFLSSIETNARSALTIVRFAASNRLCVDLDYVDAKNKRSRRLIEPYSLRQTSDEEILLYAVGADDGQLRSFRVDRIKGVKVTNRSFTARYEVELTSVSQSRSIPSYAFS